MTRFPFVLAAWAVAAAPLFGAAPKLDIPAEIKAQPGAWVVVAPDTTAKAITYIGLDGLSAFPSSELKDPRKLVVNAPAAGRYRFVAVGTLNDEQAVAPFVIVVGDAPPGPTPGPTPAPDPNNPDVPDPFGAVGGAGAFRVLIIYETADLSKLPAGQVAALTSAAVREYLNAKCAVGPDGRTREWRVWDRDVATAAESPLWQKMMAKSRPSLPWLYVGNGSRGYSGPLPENTDKLLALLKKYGGN